MYFTQKIYIHNKPLILTNSSQTYQREHPISKGYEVLTGAFSRSFRLAKQHLSSSRSLGAIIEDIDVEILQAALHKNFTNIIAGGGVVKNPAGEILMIHRRGKWDLPKGKLDEGETIEECAVREIKEETGLPEVKLHTAIGQSYHIYNEKNKDILKTTYWYHMSTQEAYPLLPQAEENISEAKWIPTENIHTYLKFTYEGVKDVLKMATVL